jgi:hypothetical protein
VLHEGRLTLDRRYFWVDASAFEALAAEAERGSDPLRAEQLAEQMLALYRGPFMAGEDDAAWVIAPRERMRSRLARAMGRVFRQWESSGQLERARDVYEKCREIDSQAVPEAGFKLSVSDR